MRKPQYEGYSDSPTVPLKEKFGDIQIFERNAQYYMSSMGEQYLGLKYETRYTLDDYAILARRKE